MDGGRAQKSRKHLRGVNGKGQQLLALVLLKDSRPSSRRAFPTPLQRPLCPFSYNDTSLLSSTMHPGSVFGSDLHDKRSPRQQVSIGQVGLIAATTQWPPAPAVGRVETGKGHGENEHRMTCR